MGFAKRGELHGKAIKKSKNYYKCKHQLAILYSKLKNARNYYLHKITKQITDENDIIITEKLQTKKRDLEISIKEIEDLTSIQF